MQTVLKTVSVIMFIAYVDLCMYVAYVIVPTSIFRRLELKIDLLTPLMTLNH